jgi:very-short-patch-repair endonuclease
VAPGGLHYDPLTARQRGFEVLLRQRMDLLLLLPADARVVLEVDGVRHYHDSQGRPHP